jgi:hypothetical protein
VAGGGCVKDRGALASSPSQPEKEGWWDRRRCISCNWPWRFMPGSALAAGTLSLAAAGATPAAAQAAPCAPETAAAFFAGVGAGSSDGAGLAAPAEPCLPLPSFAGAGCAKPPAAVAPPGLCLAAAGVFAKGPAAAAATAALVAAAAAATRPCCAASCSLRSELVRRNPLPAGCGPWPGSCWLRAVTNAAAALADKFAPTSCCCCRCCCRCWCGLGAGEPASSLGADKHAAAGDSAQLPPARFATRRDRRVAPCVGACTLWAGKQSADAHSSDLSLCTSELLQPTPSTGTMQRFASET